MKPIYRAGDISELPTHGNKGLWFERFFDYGTNWSISDTEKKNFLAQFKGSCGDKAALKSNAINQLEIMEALGGESVVLETTWNFVTGMGLPHPIENGLSWHPTLGVPYLAGCAVKGLLRAWVEEWMEFSNDNEKLLTLFCWFGSEDKDPIERAKLRKSESNPLHGNKNDTIAGDLIFLDAIPIEPVALTKDIMTPHMGKWYEKGGDIANADDEPQNIPADWHDPVPVPFLAVKKARFLFSVAPSKRLADKAEVEKALNTLVMAIEFLGAGAKTAVGYGRMQKDEKTLASLKEELRKKRERLQQRREAEEKEHQHRKELDAMPPLDREIEELIQANSDKNMKPYVLLFQKLESDHWTDTSVKRQVAEKIREFMQADKAWKGKSSSKKPEKDRDFQRTLAVMKYLQ